MSELRLVRALDRIEGLKREGRWSFRQPKKQRGVGGLIKTHSDYLMDEIVRLSLFLSCSLIQSLMCDRDGCELTSAKNANGR